MGELREAVASMQRASTEFQVVAGLLAVMSEAETDAAEKMRGKAKDFMDRGRPLLASFASILAQHSLTKAESYKEAVMAVAKGVR